jgi:hypothetical protein
VPVGPLSVRRRGRPVGDDEVAAALATSRRPFRARPRSRSTHRPCSTSSAWRSTASTTRSSGSVTRSRGSRGWAARRGGRGSLDALDEADRPCLREIGRGLDVVEAGRGPARGRRGRGARPGARGRVPSSLQSRAFDASDATLAGARRALACGVGRGLEGALRLLDAAERS